jgi:hypothetical protein
VDEAYLTSGTYEIEVAGRRIPCTLHLRPLYDPGMARVKGREDDIGSNRQRPVSLVPAS